MKLPNSDGSPREIFLSVFVLFQYQTDTLYTTFQNESFKNWTNLTPFP